MSVNIQPMPAGRALDALRAGWAAQSTGALTVSWMLHGRPGVGKTEIVSALAAEIGARLFDLRLTIIEPQDLRGLPYYDHEAGKTVWYRPEDLPDDPETPSVLFLDELTAAPPMLQPVVYGLLQERRVGRHRLPDSVFVVAAGNAVEDGAVAHDLGTALSDRLVHLRIEAEARDWVANVGLARGLHPAVTAFIRTRPDLLETTEAAFNRGETVFATPRSWVRVSEIMGAVGDRRLRAAMIEGTLGAAVAAEFQLVAEDIAATLALDDLLTAPKARRTPLYPATLHGLNALIYALAARLDAETLRPAIEILAELPALKDRRPEPVFATLPLRELATHGFEILIRRGLDLGFGEAMLAVPEMADHMARHAADSAA
ncbi:MAG: MoxR family ATPase [Paracoccaceae bacterium]|nr:MoxR family ATPase [Paracoccaceae bacterium]